MGMTGIVFVRPAGRHVEASSGRHEVRLQRQRRLDRVRPPLRDPAERDLVQVPRRRPRHPGDRSRPTTTRSGSRSTAACYPQTILPNDDPSLPDDMRITHRQREQRRRSTQPAELVADPGEPRRSRAAAARQPRLPAARDGAAGHPDAGRRPGRDLLRRRRRVDTSYRTNTIYIGPGRGARRALRRAGLQRPDARRDRRPAASTTPTTSRTGTCARSSRTTARPAPAG